MLRITWSEHAINYELIKNNGQRKDISKFKFLRNINKKHRQEKCGILNNYQKKVELRKAKNDLITIVYKCLPEQKLGVIE